MDKPWPGASERYGLWVIWSGTNPPFQRQAVNEQKYAYNTIAAMWYTVKPSYWDLKTSFAYKQACQVHPRCQIPLPENQMRSLQLKSHSYAVLSREQAVTRRMKITRTYQVEDVSLSWVSSLVWLRLS